MASAAAKLIGGITRGDPAEVMIPRVFDDPEYAAAAELLAAFSARMETIERERQCIAFEAHFDGRDPAGDGDADKVLRARWTALRKASADAAPATKAPATTAQARPPAIAAALAMLDGQPVAARPNRSARMAELERQHAIMWEAVREQNDICDAIAGDLTLKYARQLQPAWNALQLEMYRAAQELSRSARRVQDFRARITAAGIRSRTDVLAMPNVRAPLMLGDESVFDSEISGWRRILERLGIL